MDFLGGPAAFKNIRAMEHCLPVVAMVGGGGGGGGLGGVQASWSLHP